MNISKQDILILQELGKEYASIASLPVQNEKKNLWKKLNGLEKVRPLVIIDQLPWHELNTNGALNLLCENDFLRRIEKDLRQTIYKYKNFAADMVVDNYIKVPMWVRNFNYGISSQEILAVTDKSNSVKSHKYIDLLENEDQVEKLTPPTVTVDKKFNQERLDALKSIFDGIIDVKLTGITMHCGIWDIISTLRGVENILYDMVDRPEFIEKTVDKFVMIGMSLLDQAENLGILDASQSLIHCTGAYTNELPSKDFDENAPKAKDVWGFGLAQLFATISPTMFEEFEIRKIKPLLERFGLIYYGCCDPLDTKMEIVKSIKNVRKISVSPWSNVTKCAEAIGSDYVLSRKPNPSLIATNFDEDSIKKEVLETIEISKKYNCPCELILKDISTVGYKPENIVKWEKLVMDIVTGF